MDGTTRLSRAAAIVLLSWSPMNLTSQGTWNPTVTTGGPAGRFGHSATYNLAHDKTVLFGGLDTAYTTNAETWEFDGLQWHAVTTAAVPSARCAHTLAYDFLRDRVVLFGGTNSAFLAVGLDDTWEFDGVQWQQALPAHIPPGRFNHAMTYDLGSGCALVHGGRSVGSSLLGDTWGWNGIDWVLLAANGPSARYHHAMCFDLQRTRTVLFGGRDTMDLADTWEWDGAQWLQPTTGGPTPRNGHALVYDLARAVTVLHGGSQGGDETWEWDGNHWALVASGATLRRDHAMVFDARLQRATLFGGVLSTAFAVFSDVMNYDTPLPGSFQSVGASCAGANGTPLLAPSTASLGGPALGSTSILEVSPVAGETFLLFGLSHTYDGSLPLPHDLTPLGMNGCTLQVSRDAVTSAPSLAGTASFGLAVPNDPFLTSFSFYVQAFPLDLAANALGFTSTNTLIATVGRN